MCFIDQLYLCSCKIYIGRNEINSRNHFMNDCFIDRTVAKNQLIDSIVFLIFIHTKPAGCISLRINVNNQYFLSFFCQCC